MTSDYSVQQFLRRSGEHAAGGETFEQESDRLLRVEIDGGVWLKPGAAIAYRGGIRFERLATLAAHSVKDAAFRELAPLVRAAGRGRLYCADRGAHVRVIRLAGDTLFVTAREVLALEESLRFEPALVANGIGVAAGGVIVLKVSGHGSLALATHGEPLTLSVTPESPVSTDPHATVAWSGTLSPSLKTDLSWHSVIGHGGQEPVQMFFVGTGFVVVQPFEDRQRLSIESGMLERVSALLTA